MERRQKANISKEDATKVETTRLNWVHLAVHVSGKTLEGLLQVPIIALGEPWFGAEDRPVLRLAEDKNGIMAALMSVKVDILLEIQALK